MARHDGTENLVSLANRTTEEQREIASKGGKASAEARRERKALKEELLLLLEQDNRQERISIALLDKAANGDVAAYKLIAEMLGEYQQQQKVDLNLPDITLVKSECKKK
jgi:pantothenate kinase